MNALRVVLLVVSLVGAAAAVWFAILTSRRAARARQAAVEAEGILAETAKDHARTVAALIEARAALASAAKAFAEVRAHADRLDELRDAAERRHAGVVQAWPGDDLDGAS